MKLVYFEKWMDPIGERTLGGRKDIDLVRLEYGAAPAANWSHFADAHGYHISPRGDLQEPWFANDALIARSPNLLAISSTGAGYDVIDVEACNRAGIIVCNQTGMNTEAVAEHALGLMLALSKNIATTDRMLRRGDKTDRFVHAGHDIQGKTVGIVGIGNIGSRVSQLCGVLFGMTVLAYDPYLTAEQIAARGAKKVELDELLAAADFVTVHCPRSDETFGMFGYERFARMKPSAFFLNTARGGIHREDELARALREKRIAGAGLDVFLVEPPPKDHPLLGFDNVIVTPHNAGVTHEAMYNVARAGAEQWIEIFTGAVPPRLINPEIWPRYCDRFEKLFGFRPAALP